MIIDIQTISNKSAIHEYIGLMISELKKHVNKYIENLNFIGIDLNAKLSFKNFLIQKYKMGLGNFKCHEDFSVDDKTNKYRCLNFIWYLNEVEIGGETAMIDNYKIKPQIGKLVLFPSEWFYIHCGNIPQSSDKYIITGWIMIDF